MFSKLRNWFGNFFQRRRFNKARKLWIKALRSGEYQQTSGLLCESTPDGNRYCCLGVACEVYDKNVAPLTRGTGEKIEFDHCLTVLPLRVANWLGMTTGGQLKQPVYGLQSLIGCNDIAGLTFDQIADVIEGDNLKGAL